MWLIHLLHFKTSLAGNLGDFTPLDTFYLGVNSHTYGFNMCIQRPFKSFFSYKKLGFFGFF